MRFLRTLLVLATVLGWGVAHADQTCTYNEMNHSEPADPSLTKGNRYTKGFRVYCPELKATVHIGNEKLAMKFRKETAKKDKGKLKLKTKKHPKGTYSNEPVVEVVEYEWIE